VLGKLHINTDEAVVSSGDYQRKYYDKSGVKIHNIINPITGMPSRGLQSVTIVYPNALRADAAATALMVAGDDNWRELADKMHLGLVLVVTSKGKVAMTTKMQSRVISF